MSLLGNPVPTSGEVRALRRRLGEHLALLTPVTDPDVAVLVTAADVPVGFVRFVPYPQQRIQQMLTEPRVRRLLQAVAVAGRAGLDTLEQVTGLLDLDRATFV